MYFIEKTIGNICIRALMIAILFFALIECSLKAEERCLKEAWQAFNNHEYKQAIKYANRCINRFGAEAEKIQKKLKAEPPKGVVPDPKKKEIFNNSLLNDVATACWIKGRSAEILYEKTKDLSYKEIAKQAYKALCEKYAYGRTWDPRGWFWSPAEDACERLSRLDK